jgi:hypothetical protein
MFLQGRYENQIEKSSFHSSKIDAAACILLIIIATAVFYKFLTYPLPVGYDTPIYLANAKLLMNKELSIQSILWGREIYYKPLSILLSIVKDDIILGKLLWTQVFLIIGFISWWVGWLVIPE